MPFHESDNPSRVLDLEFNNRRDFDFDSHFVPEGSSYKDPTPASHILNEFIGGDAPAVPSQQSAQANFLRDVVSSTPHLSNVDWKDYLDFPPNTCSSVGAPAVTFDLLHHSPGQSSILHGWKTPSPELFISNDSVRVTSGPVTTFEGISLEAITKPMMLVDDTFLMSLSELSDDQSSGISEDVVEWVASEFRYLLAASHKASASALRKRSLKLKTNEAS